MRGLAAAGRGFVGDRRHRHPLDCASLCFWLAEPGRFGNKAWWEPQMTIAVLFVCMGNICRSPLAEAAFRAEAERLGLDVEVDSAGTGDWHAGEPPDRRAQAVGAAPRRRHLAAARAAGAPRRLSTGSTISSRSTGESRRARGDPPGGRARPAVAAARPCRRAGRGSRSPIPIMAAKRISKSTWTRRQPRARAPWSRKLGATR